MDNRKIIPRFEPEVIEATAKKHYRGDDEKVATTSIRTLVVFGVSIVSRYDKADEYDLMQAMICALRPALREQIKSIFCDSKADCFSVILRNWRVGIAHAIGYEIEATVIARCGGHNGIFVGADRGCTFFGDPDRQIEVGANWQDD
jgi:hypothetical protein